MVLLHVAVKIIQVVFAVVAAVARPAVFAGLYPGVVSVKRVRISGVLVLVDEQRRIGPGPGHLAHAVPVSSGFFREDEDHRPAVIAKIGVARGACVRPNVTIKKILQVYDHRVSVIARMVDGFVILHRDFEGAVSAGRLLQQRVALVFKLLARAIPVHHEPADIHLPGAGDLLPQHVGIMAKARRLEMTERGWIQAKIRKANTLVSAFRFRSGRYLVFGLFSAPPLEAAGALEDAAAPAFVALPSMMVANSPPSTDASYLKS